MLRRAKRTTMPRERDQRRRCGWSYPLSPCSLPGAPPVQLGPTPALSSTTDVRLGRFTPEGVGIRRVLARNRARPTVDERDFMVFEEVARALRPSRVPGVKMAGFRRGRALGPFEMWTVPHPAVTLALELGGNGPLILDTAARRQMRGSLVAGLGPAARVRGQEFECVQVRLSPVAAHAVLGVSPAELERTAVVLDDLWGSEASRIQERLSEASSWRDRFTLIDAFLARRTERGPSMDPEVAWVWNRIVGRCGMVRVEELAAEIGWSRKRLWRRFRSQVGLPPKYAMQLVRFDYAAHRLAAGEGTARVAAEAGYVDQSHLYRDVRAFSGGTPATLAKNPWLAVDGIAWAGGGTFVQDPRPPGR